MHQIRPSLLTAASLLLVLLGSLPQPTCAHPFPKDDLHEAGYGYLMARQCDQYCGYNNMYCCSAGSQCYTSNGIAGCSDPAGGGVAWYTTTWTETETFTSTISSIVPAATGPGGAACVPEEGTGQIACGSICCASWQYCAYKGQCYANGPVDGGGGGGGGGMQTTTITSNGHVITTQFSAPQRVTGTPTATQTSTSSVTGTQAGATGTGTGNGPVSAGGTSKKLSGGAIAGIVIGTIAGVMLLLLLCACCVMRGLWHGLLALLGLGSKKKKKHSSRETVIEEERYSRYGSPHSRRNTHGGWFGGGGRPSSAASRKEKKKSGGVGLLGIGAAIGTLLLLLGLRRDKKRKATRARSEVSSTYYTDSYTTTNPSSASSRPTRVSRHSRDSRGTRVSRAPPRSRRESRAGSRRS